MYAIRHPAYAAPMEQADPVSIPNKLAALARRVRRVAVLTGAGISAESGVPTFRDAQTGIWARFDPMQLATPEAFARDPERVWDWYCWRRELVAQAAPNAGHRALAQWERSGVDVTVATQNVDGLHRRAGSSRVITLHGDITRTLCSARCGEVTGWESDSRRPPRCPTCDAPLRPGVVWFGEMLPAGALEAAAEAVGQADLVLSVGTSSLVQPAASLPEVALDRAIPVVEINPEPTPLSPRAAWRLDGTAATCLPALVEGALEKS